MAGRTLPSKFRCSLVRCVLGFALAAATASAPSALAAEVRGPSKTTVEMLRMGPEGTKVYVRATLPDGSAGIFMVDTGADVSVLAVPTAQRLGLRLTTGSQIAGVTGVADVRVGELAWLRLGDNTVTDVEVAVGAPFRAEIASGVPLDGILGNNVWSRFVMDLDYRADELTLYRPGTFKMPKKAAPMRFDGGHLFAPVQFVHADSPNQVGRSWVVLDTGAHDLLFRGSAAVTFPGEWTEGVEPILGVTSSDTLPASALLRSTRRVAADRVALGGVRLEVDFDVVWMDFDSPRGRDSWAGLVGNEVFDGHRVIFDFWGGEFAILPGRGKPAFHDARQEVLQLEMARHGRAPGRTLIRASLMLAMDRMEEALVELESLVRSDNPELAEVRRTAIALVARIRRSRGEFARADELYAMLKPHHLIEEGELVGVVNGLLLQGHLDEAERIATIAREDAPEEGDAWVAWADVQLARGSVSEANEALLEAAHLHGNPDAHLLRRARVAIARRDQDAALSLLRDGLQLNPLDGKLLWFYARVAGAEDRETLLSDLASAVARVHPRMLPRDFLAGAMSAAGESDDARLHMRKGIARDCVRDEPSSHDNCVAWYQTLGGVQLDDALERVQRALLLEGERSDFLDTLAMVHLARRDLGAAREAALAAARMSPEDPYMLWQADWLSGVHESP